MPPDYALSLMWVLMRKAVWPVLWRHPAVSALLGGQEGACFSLRYLQQGLLFSARKRSASLYEPWATPCVVVVGGETLHLKLELVESQGELLCFCVEERLGRRAGLGIEICIGPLDGSQCVLPPLG